MIVKVDECGSCYQQYMSAKETKLSRFTEGRMSLLEIGRNLDKSQIDFKKKLSPFYLYSSSDKNDAHETNTGEEE